MYFLLKFAKVSRAALLKNAFKELLLVFTFIIIITIIVIIITIIINIIIIIWLCNTLL